MQFTTVRSKEKDYDIYLKSEKLVHSQQEHFEKQCSNFSPDLFGSGKNWFLAISSLTNTVAAIWREKNYVDPCYLLFGSGKNCGSLMQLFGHRKKQQLFGTKKKTVRSKEKDYDIYLKSEKLVYSQQEHEKKCFPAIWKWKKLVPSYFQPDKHCYSYLEREKSGSLLFGDQKIQFTTVRSKEKDYDIYLKSQPVGARKKCYPAIWKQKKLVPSYFEPKNKKCISKLLEARKKIMTSI